MKIKINGHGNLEIERAGKMKRQSCPCSTESNIPCGDWCPLFEEPQFNSDRTQIFIQLCQTTLYCPVSDFTDERPQ